MDFIIGLAHFCEVHGPTSILCTQVIPPTCITCNPPLHTSVARPPNTQLAFNVPTPPGSSYSYNHSNNNPVTLQHVPKNSHFPRTSADITPASSPKAASPSNTPPSSPQSPVLTTAPLPNAAIGGGAPSIGASSREDSCRNCSISFPKSVNDSLMGVAAGISTDGRITSSQAGWGTKTPLRSTETVLVGVPRSFSIESGSMDSSQNLTSSPKFNSPFDSTGLDQNISLQGALRNQSGFTTHPHTITYISSRSPTAPSRYATVRQSCIRTLSCELVPAQTGPMLFGDPLAGYTIAFVFRLADAKARGSRRTYALLCMSPNQKALIHCWNSVTFVFQNLVHEIQHSAADKAAKESQSPPSLGNSISSVASRGPEGFLRRRAPGDGGSQKCLAELVGREDFFVELHAKFVCLLSKLTKIYGHTPQGNHDLVPATLMPLSMTFSLDGRNRNSSIGSTVSSDEQRDRRNVTFPVVPPPPLPPPRQDLQQPQQISPVVPSPINKTTQSSSAFTPRKSARIPQTTVCHAETSISSTALSSPATGSAKAPPPKTLTGSSPTLVTSNRHDEELAQCSSGIERRRQVAVGY